MLSRKPKLKRLRDQIIVVTGASSGIGLETSKMAAARGARVVMASRNEQALRLACDEIRARGGRATLVVADVADPDALDRVAEVGLREFGGIDTWINNAGVSAYGKLTEMALDDKRRIFDTNFWGVVNGCRAAITHLRRSGGVIINLGSVVSDRAVPLQGIYSASKQAVQGYTDALRLELERDGLPIWVTLVKPAANMRHLTHARNVVEPASSFPPPIYAPEVVAEAILRCAERRVREITVGGGKVMSVLGRMAPRTADLYMESALIDRQHEATRPGIQRGADVRQWDGPVHGPRRGPVMRSSVYTKAMFFDAGRVLPFIAAGVALAAGIRSIRGGV